MPDVTNADLKDFIDQKMGSLDVMQHRITVVECQSEKHRKVLFGNGEIGLVESIRTLRSAIEKLQTLIDQERADRLSAAAVDAGLREQEANKKKESKRWTWEKVYAPFIAPVVTAILTAAAILALGLK